MENLTNENINTIITRILLNLMFSCMILSLDLMTEWICLNIRIWNIYHDCLLLTDSANGGKTSQLYIPVTLIYELESPQCKDFDDFVNRCEFDSKGYLNRLSFGYPLTTRYYENNNFPFIFHRKNECYSQFQGLWTWVIQLVTLSFLFLIWILKILSCFQPKRETGCWTIDTWMSVERQIFW